MAAQPQQDLQERPADVTGRGVDGQDPPQRPDRPFGVGARPVHGSEREHRLPAQCSHVAPAFRDEGLGLVVGQQLGDQTERRPLQCLRRERLQPSRLP
nr:hypothetical protein [Streptomyces flavochromogenes]